MSQRRWERSEYDQFEAELKEKKKVLKRISHMTEDLCNKVHVALQNKTPLKRLNIEEKKSKNKIRSRVLCDSSQTYRVWDFPAQMEVRGWASGGRRGRGNFISWVERADVTWVAPF